MPTISPTLLPILMLFASNVFMTFAWYGHLKFKESPLPLVIMASWGIAFFEYWLAVPANRWGSAVYSAAQLKTMQEVITLVVFAGFSVLYLKEPLGWNHALGLCFHRRRRVFDFSQMGVNRERPAMRVHGAFILRPAPPARSVPPNCRSAATARRPGPGGHRESARSDFAAGVPPTSRRFRSASAAPASRRAARR